MEYKDYYKVLGLERNATQDQVKRTYRKLALVELLGQYSFEVVAGQLAVRPVDHPDRALQPRLGQLADKLSNNARPSAKAADLACWFSMWVVRGAYSDAPQR
jgi:hypothetical protein